MRSSCADRCTSAHTLDRTHRRGATRAGIDALLFWGSLAFSLVVAFCVTVPVNRWLIGRGKGHAVAHRHHH